jgi:leucyl aminopeptidase
MIDVAITGPALPEQGALILLVAQGAARSGLWQHADEATGGAITRGFAAAAFTGASGQTCTILAPGAGLSRVVAAGLGADPVTPRALEAAGGNAAAAVAQEQHAAIAADGLDAAQAASVALGAVLRAWRFDRYRTKEKPEDKPKLRKLAVLANDPVTTKLAWHAAEAVAHGVFLTRELVSEPANVLTPVEFADRCTSLEALGLEVEVLHPKELHKLGFGAFLGVAQGSENPARVVVMKWAGAAAPKSGKGKGKPAKHGFTTRPVAFIGKGVTFDTGGISIKPAGGMEDMKWDMAGAGAVTGLMATLARRRAKVDALGIVGLVENMPSGNAQRPGDVVTSYSGQTIEVINTDAEGRLVLADIIWYAKEKYDPAFMVDLATLTGAIIIGLGHEHAGLFSNNDDLAAQLLAAGIETGEKLWRMPLDPAYDKQIDSDIADMKNVGGRPGGAITAAQFIARFVDSRPWAHLDIAGMAWAQKDLPVTPKGATAFGVRLLNRLVATHYEQP